MKNIAILISGRGTNLQALIDAQQANELAGRIQIIISNKRNALGLERAQKASICTKVFDDNELNDPLDQENQIISCLEEYQTDLVVLAGYMKILSPKFVQTFKNKIINIHPSLLPSFPGLHAQQQALDYGVKITGCTTHFVSEDLDNGPIILQKSVKVLEDDDAITLSERILNQEHLAIVETVNLFCREKLQIINRTVKIN